MKNKDDIARSLKEKNVMTLFEASKIVDDVFDYIAEQILLGEDINIVNFGKFYLLFDKERIVKHPRTGDIHNIKRRPILKFKASEKVKRKLKENEC